MPRQIIVSFRGAVALDAAGGARYLERALSTKKRAEAHGATLCAWSAWTFSFALMPEELEEAMTLASLAFDEEGFGVGVAEGEMSEVGERGSLSGLQWGLPLVTAGALSRAASAGEVLIDPAMLARCEKEIEAMGFHAEGQRIKRLVPGPAIPARPPMLSEPPPFEPNGRASIPDIPLSTRGQDPVAEMAKRALLQGDVNALERLILDLQDSGGHPELVERMAGFVALRRGATADALRRLRLATEATKEPAKRARAGLAYGVALASAGRTESALLEALEALARAREAGDPHGEHACALFLARLSAAAGHPAAANVWARVASKAELHPAG